MFRFLCIFGFLVLLAGCLSLPEDVTPPTVVCDLSPLKIPANRELRFTVEPFLNQSQAEFKMVSFENGRSEREEFSKWIQTPQSMLTREYSRLFSGPGKTGKTPARYFSGTVLVFQKNAGKDGKTEAVLSVRYQISDTIGKILWSRTLTDTAVIQGKGGNAFASAMSENLQNQADSLLNILKKEFP